MVYSGVSNIQGVVMVFLVDIYLRILNPLLLKKDFNFSDDIYFVFKFMRGVIKKLYR